MYIKLNFTAAKSAYQVFRTINEIINTSSINSISALTAAATAGSWDATLTSNLNVANSEIIRDNDLYYTKSHYAGTNSTKLYTFTIEHSVFDNTDRKFYTQFSNATASTLQILHQMGTTISGGTISSTKMGPNVADSSAVATGVALTLGGTTSGTANTLCAAGTGGDDVFTFWMYITDTCMIWAINNNAAAPVGWPGSYSLATSLAGPFIMSQYTRDDYWNADTTDYNTPVFYPVALSNYRGAGVGFGSSGIDIASASATTGNTPMYVTADASACPLKVLNMIDTSPSTATTAPTVLTNQRVCLTIDGLSQGHRALAAESNVTTAGTFSSRVLLNVANAGYKIPDATLTIPVYGHHDIGWEMSLYCAFGGSLSQQGGFYLFNGDYTPGDEYYVSGTTYSIWPLYGGSATRMGLSIPKA
jgi:hypothetical protein